MMQRGLSVPKSKFFAYESLYGLGTVDAKGAGRVISLLASPHRAPVVDQNRACHHQLPTMNRWGALIVLAISLMGAWIQIHLCNCIWASLCCVQCQNLWLRGTADYVSLQSVRQSVSSASSVCFPPLGSTILQFTFSQIFTDKLSQIDVCVLLYLCVCVF